MSKLLPGAGSQGCPTTSAREQGSWGTPSPRHQAPPWDQAEAMLGHQPKDGGQALDQWGHTWAGQEQPCPRGRDSTC